MVIKVYCSELIEPNYYEYIKNIKLILEKYGFEEPVKRDGKLFESDDRDLKEKFESLKKRNMNKNQDNINVGSDENTVTSFKEDDKNNVRLSEIIKRMNNPITKTMGDKVLEKLKNDSVHDNKNLHNIPEGDFASNIFNGISKMNAPQEVPKEVPRIVPLKSDSMKSLERVIDTINKKDKQYFKDPIQVLSVDDLLTQIKIKAIRAKLTLEDEKRMDELLDIAVYSILTLEKMLMEPVNEYNGVENFK